MSHFAELDNNNKVIRVLVGDNKDPAGDEGYQWLIDNLGGTWVQTSFNSNFRFNFAAIDYFYDSLADAFIPPKPSCNHPELTLNKKNFKWECESCADEFI